jgi:hypothetical protein
MNEATIMKIARYFIKDLSECTMHIRWFFRLTIWKISITAKKT